VFDPDGPVLGVDPGVSRCGYGAVAGQRGAPLRILACGVVRTGTSEPLPARLATLEHALDALVRELRPVALAVERVLFQANVRTAMSVGQASGLALAVASRAGVPVFHYSPNEVKLAVTGHGGAEKAQVQAMVAQLLGLRERPRPADAADALALAICHQWGGSLRRRVEAGQGGTDADASGDRLRRAVAAALAREDAS
jgi:crossover junction endodeoxyribonuclease RuvC